MIMFMNNMSDTDVSHIILEDLDDSWINSDIVDLTDDKLYQNYYTEAISCLNVNLIYINKCNEIEKISEQHIILNEVGIVSRDELIRVVKKGSRCNNIKYKLMSLLIYAIDLRPENLKDFLNNTQNSDNFIKPLNTFDMVNLNESISLFHDLNEITIIYHNPSSISVNARSTRRYNISNTIKYTKRKRYKDKTT